MWRPWRSSRTRWGIWALILACLLLPSCLHKRSRFHLRADRETHRILHEKTCRRPWELPPWYSLDPPSQSRLFDPSHRDDPALPHPGPHLHCYNLPPVLPSELSDQYKSAEKSPSKGASEQPNLSQELRRLPPVSESAPIQQTTFHAEQPHAGRHIASLVEPLPAPTLDAPENVEGPPDDAANDNPLEKGADEGEKADPRTSPADEPNGTLPIQPIPEVYWDELPDRCLSRMLEFEPIQEEYRRQFKKDPGEGLLDDAQKLIFYDIYQLAVLNSREYQTQKEQLYAAALALTLERFDYLLKFSPNLNGTSVNFNHVRTDGITVNTLSVPSTLQLEKMIALGGTLIARFANNVVLTFNGPQGFAEDISSNLLFELSQSIFQRDVLLEPLTQAERNVVYAARDYARFRKTFFFQLASDYYGLLRTYRQIEINAQNYFSLVRALDQAEAEVRAQIADAPPRFQIDQVEQQMLGGRSTLIGTCNNLETGLDNLKLTMGLPTEMPINLDLTELEQLTLRDEIEVAAELMRRSRARVRERLSVPTPDREEILSTAIVLIDRSANWLKLRGQLEGKAIENEQLEKLRIRLRIHESQEAADRVRVQLEDTRRSEPPAAPIFLFLRTMDLVQARIDLASRFIDAATDSDERDQVLQRLVDMQAKAKELRERGVGAEDLRLLRADAEQFLDDAAALFQAAGQLANAADRPAAEEELRQTIEDTHQLLQANRTLVADSKLGLTPVDMHVDDAMVTGLVQRLDLMNERGFLADDWRAVKIAADELKSVLNLNVRQSFQTRNNRPFAFSFRDSRTELRATFDLPLNRRAQRNGYRRSLINFQAGRRSLMALEDRIKFDVRNDLRQLELDRAQYDIIVASAALASERVFSTRLELTLGLGQLTARDFLEAQNAFQQSLILVANRRIDYILNRAQFALDLELLILDETGFWPELTNDEYVPKPDPIYPRNAGPTYGELPPVWHSKKIRRMRHVPLPGYKVISASLAPASESQEESDEPADKDIELLPPVDPNG